MWTTESPEAFLERIAKLLGKTRDEVSGMSLLGVTQLAAKRGTDLRRPYREVIDTTGLILDELA